VIFELDLQSTVSR